MAVMRTQDRRVFVQELVLHGFVSTEGPMFADGMQRGIERALQSVLPPGRADHVAGETLYADRIAAPAHSLGTEIGEAAGEAVAKAILGDMRR
jgi:hypothetical protein